MHSTINVCFMCITDKNCTDVNKNVLTLVEYILPEITLIKLDVNLRICSVCEETICLFSKFKGVCVENSLLLETTIKEAQSYKNRRANTNEENSPASTSNNEQIEEVILKPQRLLATSQNGNDSESEKEESIVEEDDIDDNLEGNSSSKDVEEVVIDEKDAVDDNLEENSSTEEGESTSKKPYSCPICKCVFKYKYSVQHHMVLSHSHTKKQHKCHLCPAEYARRTTLNRHLMVIHAKIKKFHCAKCNKRFGRKCDLRGHICHTTIKTTEHKKDEKEKNYKCKECNRTFWQRPNLVLHMKVHDEESKIKCHICQKSFTQSGIIFHRLGHEKRAKIKCQCGEFYSHNIHLKHHPDYQHEPQPLKYVRKKVECPECKRYIREDYMKEHIRVHQGAKEYQCDICKQKFNRINTLQVHMMRGVHKKDKRS